MLGLGSPTLSAARRELPGLDEDLSLEEDLRPRVPLRRAALHPSAVAHLDRLSRHPGRVHARAAGSTTSRTAAARPTCSSEYAIRNPREFAGYGEYCWGITASDGPGPRLKVDGVERHFYDYPRAASRTARTTARSRRGRWSPRCRSRRRSCCRRSGTSPIDVNLETGRSVRLQGSFNPTYPVKSDNAYGWVSPWNYRNRSGPHRVHDRELASGLIWRLMRSVPTSSRDCAGRDSEADGYDRTGGIPMDHSHSSVDRQDTPQSADAVLSSARALADQAFARAAGAPLVPGNTSTNPQRPQSEQFGASQTPDART